MSSSKWIVNPANSRREAGQRVRNAVCSLRVMTSLEFLQHHFAQMSHSDTSL